MKLCWVSLGIGEIKVKNKEIYSIYPLDKLKLKNHHYHHEKENLAILSPNEDENNCYSYSLNGNAITTLGYVW